MFKRLFILFWIISAVVPTLAQTPPDPINAALQDISTRVNRTVTLSQVTEWNYQQSVYPSPALGCPQPGVAYTDVLTSGYQFIITYGGTVYDYRVSDDRSIVVLCGTAPATDSVPPCPPPDDPDFLPPRLSKGIQAKVAAAGLPNVIREQPGSSSRLLGQIPAGDPFIVIDGPRCTTLDKIVWWQINYNNLIGWTGEGQDGIYWLEPRDIDLTPTASPAPDSENNDAQLTSLVTINNPVAISADGNLYAWAKDDAVVVSNIDSQEQLVGFSQNIVKATSLAFNATGSVLAAGMENGEIRLFDMTAKPVSGTDFRLLSGHTGAITAVTFSSDGTLLASASADKTLRLWNAATDEVLATVNIDSASISGLTFTADHTHLVAHDQAGANTIYAVKTELVG